MKMNIKIFQCCLLLTAALIGFTSCNRKRNLNDFHRMEHLNSIVDAMPEAVIDSLESFDPNRLSRYNHAYLGLLDVISKDKTYFDFTNDSLISAVVKTLAGRKHNQPEIYARALFYQGLVRYRMGIADSTAYQPLKEAADLFDKNPDKTLSTAYLNYYYLGLVNFKLLNFGKAIEYYQKSAAIADRLNRPDYSYNSIREIFWSYLAKKDTTEASYYLAVLSNKTSNDKNRNLSIKNDSAVFLSLTGNYKKALRLTLERHRFYNAADSANLRTNHFNLSDLYMKTHSPDSAYYHARQTVLLIQDTLSTYNYLYYERLGSTSAAAGYPHEAYLGYRKAYQLHNQAVKDRLDTQIVEMEKKYDYAKAEVKALKYRNQSLLFFLFSLVLLIVLASGLMLWRKRKKDSEQKLELAETKNKILILEKLNDKAEKKQIETEKLYAERNLLIKQFLLGLYEQRFKQNTTMKNFITDLSNNQTISKNKLLATKIEDLILQVKEDDDVGKVFETVDVQLLSKFANIDEKLLKQLSRNEIMLLFTLSFTNNASQAADLLGTTESSVYARKSQLKRKISENDIKLPDVYL